MTAVVDAHLHLFRAVSPAYPRSVYERMAEADRDEPAERLLEAMAGAGVDHAVVVPLSRDDEYLGEVLQRHPGRFAGIGLFDHEHPDDLRSVEMRHYVTGFHGLRFFGLGADEASTAETLDCGPVLEYMARHGLVMWFYGDLVQLRALDLVMQRHPDLRVVMNHLAFLPDIHAEMQVDDHLRPHFDVELPPPGLGAVEELANRHPNLFVHVSGFYAFSRVAYPYRDLDEVAQRIRRAFGPDRMMMASDWPWIREEPGYSEVLQLVDVFYPDLSEVERSAIRGGTALRLFDFS